MKRITVIIILMFGLLFTNLFMSLTFAEAESMKAAEISSQVEVKGWKYVIDITGGIEDTLKYKKEGPYTIGWLTPFMSNSWIAQVHRELMEEAKNQGDIIKEVIHLDAQLNLADQISQVEDLVAKGVDAIIISPITGKSVVGVIELAMSKGIPVIVQSSQMQIGQCTAWVGVDDELFGRVTGQWLADKLNYKGNIVAFSGIAGHEVSEGRWRGAKEIFDKYPEIKILTREFAQWGVAQAKSAMASILPAYPEISGIWAGGGAMTQGAMESFTDAGKAMIPMVGEANNGFLLDWIEASAQGFSSIAFNNPTSQGAISLKLAIKALKGEPVPRKVYISGPYILTLDDVKKYARSDLEDGYWVGSTLSEEAIEDMWKK